MYSLPAIYLAVPGTVIISAQHNTPLEDLATANNYARPVIAGGTGSNNATGAATNLNVLSLAGGTMAGDIDMDDNEILNAAIIFPFDTIASAATTDLSTVGSENVTVTGTTTITSFGTAPAGTFRRLVFSGILTLTYNAASLILPQGGNVVTAVGDSLEAVSLGAGNWRVTSYERAGYNGLISGTAVTASGTAVDFTGIPSWVKRITVSMESISTNGTTGFSIQIGDSGGIETTGYVCATGNAQTSTTEFPLTGGSGAAAGVYHGIAVLVLLNASTNTWVISSEVARTDVLAILTVAGNKPLSATLDRVRIKSGNGTDTFDGGTVNILYE